MIAMKMRLQKTKELRQEIEEVNKLKEQLEKINKKKLPGDIKKKIEVVMKYVKKKNN